MRVEVDIDTIPTEEWVCPDCGSENIFVEPVGDFIDDDKTYEDDLVMCPDCNRDWEASEFLKLYHEKKNRVKCSCCNGTGWVQKS